MEEIVMKACTIRDVAQLAGVSISSVSRYLKDPTSINPIASVAVQDAIKELNYVPNPFAQNLKRENNKVIAILLPDISHDFFAKVCRALEVLFYQNNYLVMICDTDDDPVKERFYIEEMLKNRAAGILIASCGGNSDYLSKVLAENDHIMLYDRIVDGVKANLVCENNQEAGMQLAAHLIGKGHRRFAVVTGNRCSSNTQRRLLGIRQACAQAGVALDERYVFQDVSDRKVVEKVLASLIRDPQAPRCFIACNPRLMDSLVVADNKQHLDVPGQVTLAGFTNDDPRELYGVPVCSMRQDPYQVGMKTGEMMLRMIKNKTKGRTAKQVLLPMRLYE